MHNLKCTDTHIHIYTTFHLHTLNTRVRSLTYILLTPVLTSYSCAVMDKVDKYHQYNLRDRTLKRQLMSRDILFFAIYIAWSAVCLNFYISGNFNFVILSPISLSFFSFFSSFSTFFYSEVEGIMNEVAKNAGDPDSDGSLGLCACQSCHIEVV